MFQFSGNSYIPVPWEYCQCASPRTLQNIWLISDQCISVLIGVLIFISFHFFIILLFLHHFNMFWKFLHMTILFRTVLIYLCSSPGSVSSFSIICPLKLTQLNWLICVKKLKNTDNEGDDIELNRITYYKVTIEYFSIFLIVYVLSPTFSIIRDPKSWLDAPNGHILTKLDQKVVFIWKIVLSVILWVVLPTLANSFLAVWSEHCRI